jgi:hypothetical protein
VGVAGGFAAHPDPLRPPPMSIRSLPRAFSALPFPAPKRGRVRARRRCRNDPATAAATIRAAREGQPPHKSRAACRQRAVGDGTQRRWRGSGGGWNARASKDLEPRAHESVDRVRSTPPAEPPQVPFFPSRTQDGVRPKSLSGHFRPDYKVF